MKKHQHSWGVMFLAGSLFLLGRDLAATTTYSESEVDVYLQCAGNGLCSSYEFRMGDFDGAHFEDLLSQFRGSHDYPVTNRRDVFFGEDFPSGGSFPLFRYSTIIFDSLSSSVYSAIGDITGDGKDDIFHITLDRVLVTFGRGNPSGLISPPANLTLNSAPSNLFGEFSSFGDVNGDGLKDLLIIDNSEGAFIVFGSTSFGMSNSTISVTDPAHCMRILGIDRVTGVASGDVDGDHYDDIILSSTGTIYVIRGGISLPSLWDLRVSSANWTILALDDGPPTDDPSPLRVNYAADITGDGKADLGLGRNVQPFFISGANILAMGPVSDLAPGHANSLTPTMFPVIAGRYGEWILPRDFNGDGRPDLCILWYLIGTEKTEKNISLILSHSFPAGPTLSNVFPPDSIQFKNADSEAVLGDLNGDGKSDLIYQSETFPLVNVFYGYMPLENPKIVVQSRDSSQARVHLSLSVDGEPAEMKLTGDILDPPPGVWIPFQSKVDVTVTPDVGEKTITAVFRTSGARESESVSATVPLALGEAGSSVVTNLLREGGTARFEARLDAAGRLKATVYSREGRLLRVLIDEDLPTGVHVFDWDGANSDGHRVAPGIYTVIVDRAGQMDRRRVLVK